MKHWHASAPSLNKKNTVTLLYLHPSRSGLHAFVLKRAEKVLSTKKSHNGVGFGTGNRPDLLVQSTAEVGPGEYMVPGATGERQVSLRTKRSREGVYGAKKAALSYHAWLLHLGTRVDDRRSFLLLLITVPDVGTDGLCHPDADFIHVARCV